MRDGEGRGKMGEERDDGERRGDIGEEREDGRGGEGIGRKATCVNKMILESNPLCIAVPPKVAALPHIKSLETLADFLPPPPPAPFPLHHPPTAFSLFLLTSFLSDYSFFRVSSGIVLFHVFGLTFIFLPSHRLILCALSISFPSFEFY